MKVRNESGQVSIITVIVFILLFSVLTVSFSRIMVAASRQAVNDELAASAKAAAEAGIEDAKRILSYCTAEGAVADCALLNRPIENSSCTTISSKETLMAPLQRQVTSGSSVKVGGANEEEYLCLKMTMLTPDYLGSLDSNGNANGESESVVVPLRFADENGVLVSAKTIQLQWHNTSADADGSATLLAGSDLPAVSKWGGTVPAVVRAEFVAVPKGSFAIDNLVANTRAVTLRPSTTKNNFGATEVSGAYNLDSWIPSTQANGIDPKVFLLQTQCQSGSSGNGYACSASFVIPSIPGNPYGSTYLFNHINYDYYLRLQSVYQNTHFRLSAKDAAGSDLYFYQVQANVDVTGRASESLKRLNVRLDPDNGDENYRWWPDYVVDSAGKICKNMSIEAESGVDNCTD